MNPFTLKNKIGCWWHERWRAECALRPAWSKWTGIRWLDLRNRNEALVAGSDAAAREGGWRHSSWLTVARVFPETGARLYNHCFKEWPFALERPPHDGALVPAPAVSVVIPFGGSGRGRSFDAVLSAFLSQADVRPEIVVAEYAEQPELAGRLPPGVRHVRVPPRAGERGFSRARTLNAGAACATGRYLVLHDADIVVPRTYLQAIVARLDAGWDALQPLRFLFYLDESASRQFASAGGAFKPRAVDRIRQNFSGGSLAITREAYAGVGGHDEDFSGWGAEDQEMLDRIAARRMFRGGFAPAVHLWHPPQARGSADGNTGLLAEKLRIPRAERTARCSERWNEQYAGREGGTS
jgi:hypothetical protein